MKEFDTQELKQRLNAAECAVTQEAATEAPFTGKYWNEERARGWYIYV